MSRHRRDIPKRPILAITMGDVVGIGPEIIAKALARREVYDLCRPLVIGDRGALKRDLQFAERALEVHPVAEVGEAQFACGRADLLSPCELDAGKLLLGRVCEEAGRAAVEFVREAVKLALDGQVDGIVTAPLSKEAVHRAGFGYPGHTELLAELTGTRDYRMMLAAGPLRVVHVTTHVSLRRACDLITVERVFKTVELAVQGLRKLGVEKARMAVMGLNPHAGERGLFGDEEERAITPAVQRASQLGWDVVGPLPPDTVFLRAQRGEFDGVVAMYHDQGHIPLKLVGFDRGVNLTLGLPILRTSVAHGTAFDIAGKGIADPGSLLEAIKMAALMAASRRKREKGRGKVRSDLKCEVRS